jgi:hypothetical protein
MFFKIIHFAANQNHILLPKLDFGVMARTIFVSVHDLSSFLETIVTYFPKIDFQINVKI